MKNNKKAQKSQETKNIKPNEESKRTKSKNKENEDKVNKLNKEAGNKLIMSKQALVESKKDNSINDYFKKDSKVIGKDEADALTKKNLKENNKKNNNNNLNPLQSDRSVSEKRNESSSYNINKIVNSKENFPEIKLHKICLENFKSFNGKHEIGYFQNFSVVMGPNGSGKSNIIDAICFALGMKTISLRSKNLKELIFQKDMNHSEAFENEEKKDNDEDAPNAKRPAKSKPSGADNQFSSLSSTIKNCYVELHFKTTSQINLSLGSALENNSNDKNNQNEYVIKFKRTITNKGSSEFFIDDKKVQYEDYLEKLEKLRIPSKARYFILVQGAIDTLLSKKNDLSETIEFLSGSFQYKEDYESLKTQIEDINSEISKHSSEMNGIKVDKNKIKMQIQNEEKFNELIDDLNCLLEKTFLFRLVREDVEINQNLYLLSQNENSLKLTQEEKKKNLDLVKAKDSAMKNFEKNLKADDEDAEALKKKFDENNASLINCTEKIKLYEAQIFGKTSMINQQKIDIGKNKEKKASLLKASAELGKEIDLLKQKVNLEDPIENNNIPKAVIEEYQKMNNIFELESFALKKKIDEKKNDISDAKNKLNSHEKTQSSLDNDKQSLEKELKSLKDKEITHITNRANLDEKIRQLKNSIADKSKENQENMQLLSENKVKLDEITKKISAYEINNHENSKRKKISELMLKNSKVFGFLFELISPIKKQLELPVKVSLLKYLNYLIVEDNETAKECSDFLKAKEISADVIVLENIPEKAYDEGLRNKISSLGNLIIDLIDCKRKGIKEAIRYLIKDIVLCHDPTSQNINTLKQKGFQSIITIDGTLYKKGTITAGNYRNLEQYSFNYMNSNFEEFSKLQKSETEISLKIAELEQKINFYNFEQQNKIKLKLNELESSAEAAMYQINIVKENIGKIKQELKEKENILNSQLPAQMEELKDFILKKKIELGELETEEAEIKTKHFASFMAKHRLEDLKDFEKFSIEEIKRINLEMKNLEEKSIKIKSQIKSLDSQDEVLLKLEKSLQEDKEKKRNFELEKETIEKDRRINLEAYEAFKEAKSEDYKKSKALKEEIAKIQNDLDKLDKRTRGLLKNKIEYEHQISTCIENKKNILQESKLNLENFLIEIGVNMNSVFISFNINIQSYVNSENKIMDKENLIFDYQKIEKKRKYSAPDYADVEFIHEKILKIKNKFCEKIKDLDKYVKFVNLLDNEYDKLKDKEDELANKKKEISLLIQSLFAECDSKKKLFEEVKQKRKFAFEEFFDRLSVKISEVYKDLTKPLDSLSPGGTVYIYKTNNEEPYLGSVCYLPTPPGKRSIHDIDLLSGGEKTIAILCLLISIQSICQTPLLILDEIDCYLDPHHESVLERLFKSKNKDFQIIIVTHKSNIFRSAHSLLGTYFCRSKNSSIPISLDLLSLANQN